ncbi:MAG: hypothetical protein Q4D58_09265 [Synergistaceae bacterium]|nr:hypothetical protein [Synergistaceae bacterium]
MEAYTEPYGLLSKKTIDIAQALKSLQEELEAIDYYNQRINTCTNEDLKRIMAHNRDEEIEHSAMLVGWLKVYMNGWDKQLVDYVTNSEAGSMGADKDAEEHYGAAYNQDLNIGQL